MSKDNRVQLPSSQGGLLRFDSATGGSKFQFRPEVVVGMCVVVMLIVVGLHLFL